MDITQAKINHSLAIILTMDKKYGNVSDLKRLLIRRASDLGYEYCKELEIFIEKV